MHLHLVSASAELLRPCLPRGLGCMGKSLAKRLPDLAKRYPS